MLRVEDLHNMDYRQAWTLQEAIHAEVVAGADERLLLVEHPPVITMGRRPDSHVNLLASEDYLANLGVQLVHSDRGGDITFHGPGQIVAYPIVRLADHALSVGGFVRALENAAISALREFDVKAHRIQGAVGVWTGDDDHPAKICAIGVRIRRGVTLHGVALNVSTDLSFFNLIIPCGLQGKAVTSLSQLLGPAAPTMERVKSTLVAALQKAFGQVKALH
jgi:lipoyl(octanoyl) transferase